MKKLSKVLKAVLICIIAGILILLGVNLFMVAGSKGRLFTEADEAPDGYEKVLILGASKWGDKPSPMLRDRLLRGIEVYDTGKASCIIMSGDHERPDYDEVTVMCEYALERNVPGDDIIGDIYGLSTYDSMYRAKNVYGCDRLVIVTQRYHMYRSLYIAKRLGIDAIGVCAEDISYSGDGYHELRETMARSKDLIKCIIKPSSKYTEYAE